MNDTTSSVQAAGTNVRAVWLTVTNDGHPIDAWASRLYAEQDGTDTGAAGVVKGTATLVPLADVQRGDYVGCSAGIGQATEAPRTWPHPSGKTVAAVRLALHGLDPDARAPWPLRGLTEAGDGADHRPGDRHHWTLQRHDDTVATVYRADDEPLTAEQYMDMCGDAVADEGDACGGPVFDFGARSSCKQHSIARGIY